MSGDLFGEPIFAYTRAQAIADGVLIDVSAQAGAGGMLGGFRVPVAVTAALWAAIEAIPARLDGIADVRGRLHDVLWVAACAARRAAAGGAAARFDVILPRRGARAQRVTLRLDIGPGDQGEPVPTIGFPEDF